MKRVALEVPVDRFAEENGITIENIWIKSNDDPASGFMGNEFRTTLKRGGKSCTFPFMKSFSMGSDDPNINEVLNYLTQNAKETSGSMEDWQKETGVSNLAMNGLFDHLKRLGETTIDTLGVDVVNKLIDLTYPD